MKNCKRTIFFTMVVFAIYAIFALSCASTSGVTNTAKAKTPVFDVTYEYESDNPAMSIVVSPKWKNGWLSGYDGFACGFTNNTNKVAKIVWEGSTIYYGGSSYLPFIEGQKYIDAKSNPMPATALPKGGYLLKMVYSSEQPYYSSGKYGGWSMSPISAQSIQIVFQIDSEKGTEYATANISYHYEEETSE